MVLPQRIHARHPRVKGVVSAAVGSEFVFGAAQSGQRVDRVEGDDQRIGGLEAQHRFDGGEVGDDECQGRHQNRRKQCAENGDQLLAGFARRCQDGGCISRLICGRSGNRQSWQGEQLVPAVGQRARRKPMGQPARLVSMVVLKALAQQVPVSTQSVRLTMRPALVQTQPVRCLQTLHMPGKIVPAYQLYFRSGRSTPSCASLPQIGLIAIASMLLFSITPQPAPTRNDTKRGSLNAVVLTRCQHRALANVLVLGYILLRAKKQAIARADEAEWRPSLALSLRPAPPWGDRWRCGGR